METVCKIMLRKQRNKSPIPLGAWNLSEVLKSNATIYIPTQSGAYCNYETFDTNRTSGRFHDLNPTEQAEVPDGAVPADIFNQEESITFQYSITAPQPIHHHHEDSRNGTTKY
jgi:hypothetical protein